MGGTGPTRVVRCSPDVPLLGELDWSQPFRVRSRQPRSSRHAAVTAAPEPTDPHDGAAAEGSAAELAERTAQSLREVAGGPLSRLPQLLEAMVAIGSDLDVHRVLHRIAETAGR
ncbi:hypothetical protein O1L55_25860 [Streptomyces albulus]|nr:hypothetical protein [Streptomyces noursei]